MRIGICRSLLPNPSYTSGDYLESLKGQEGLKDVKLLFINRSVAIDGVKATALRRVRSGQIIEIEKTTESKPALSSSPASKHVVDLRKLVSFVYEDEHMAVLYKRAYVYIW